MKKDLDKDKTKEKASNVVEASAYVHIEQLGVEEHISREIRLATSVDVKWIIDKRATRHMSPCKQDL